jgi:hypothetical protein
MFEKLKNGYIIKKRINEFEKIIEIDLNNKVKKRRGRR